MQSFKQVEYYSPLISSRENLSRLGFTPAGRYHGFDLITPQSPDNSGPTSYALRVHHGQDTEHGAFPVVKTDNAIAYQGFFVTRQGVVVRSETGSGGVLFTLDINETGAPAFYLLLAGYTWQDSPEGSVVDYIVVPFDPTDIENPDISEYELSPTQIVLGLIRIEDGTKDYELVSYTPSPAPNFAGLDYDHSKLAKLEEPNIFKSFQSFERTHETDTETIWNSGNQTLTLNSTSNLVRIESASGLNIKNLVWNGSNNSILYINFIYSPGNSLVTGGNIFIGHDLPLNNFSTLAFLKSSSGYALLGAGKSLLDLIKTVQAQIPVIPQFSGWNLAAFPSGSLPTGITSLQIAYRVLPSLGMVFRVIMVVGVTQTAASIATLTDSFLSSLFPIETGHQVPIFSTFFGVGYYLGSPPVLEISNEMGLVGGTFLRLRFNYETGPGTYYTPETFISPFSS